MLDSRGCACLLAASKVALLDKTLKVHQTLVASNHQTLNRSSRVRRLAEGAIFYESMKPAGLQPTSLVRWSPDGSYLLSASPDGGLRLWETERWTSTTWNFSSNGEAYQNGDPVLSCSEQKALV